MSETAGREAVRGGRKPAPGEPYLSVWSESGEKWDWALPPGGGVVTIGRSSSNGVCIDWDAQVSRLHASLEHIGGQWTLVDDGLSRNGTFVNGHRLSSRVRLRDRDKVRVGGTTLTFCAPAHSVSQQTVVGDDPPSRVRLTDAQRSVLTALCRPYLDRQTYATPASNQQIAEELFLSIDGVKTHLRTLFHKFGIEDLPQNQKRARLVELALESGLVAAGER